jgi:hypothetical protein
MLSEAAVLAGEGVRGAGAATGPTADKVAAAISAAETANAKAGITGSLGMDEIPLQRSMRAVATWRAATSFQGFTEISARL